MEKLPSEVLTHILEYLSIEDRLKMALINQTWYQASLHPTLIKNDLFFFNESILFHPPYVPTKQELYSKFVEFKDILSNTKRSIVNLKYYEIKLDCIYYIPLIDNLGDRIISLSITRMPFLKDAFLDSIINNCNNLNTLELEDVDISAITNKFRKPLLKLNSITFNRVAINDCKFNQIMQCAPNLKDIGFYNCQILEWPQAINRYYPNYRDSQGSINYNSDCVFTVVNILNYLKNCKFINSLRLNNNYSISLQLPKYIKLKTLIFDTLTHFPSIPIDNNFILALGEHTSLEHLELHNFPCCLLSAVSKMHNLKRLKLDYTIDFNPNCKDDLYLQKFFESMENFKNIKELAIIPCGNTKKTSPSKKQIPDSILKSLTSLTCSIGNCMNIINFGGNLTTLQIHNCDILTSTDFQLLFSNLTNLMHVGIDDCCNVNDDVFLALNISNVKGLITLDVSEANLSYRCLRSIKLLHLKVLSLSRISVGQYGCDELTDEDLINFQSVILDFAQFVPSLTSLSLTLKSFHIEPSEIYLNLLKLYCTNLSEFLID